MPQPPNSPIPPLNTQDARSLKIAQNLTLVGSLAGPVSLFIGGVLLGLAGLTCAIIGFRKLNKLTETNPNMHLIIKRVKRSSIIAMVICGIAIVLNAISAYMMFPLVMEALQTGDYRNLGGGISELPGNNSTWG